jgi:hypothetical protein
MASALGSSAENFTNESRRNSGSVVLIPKTKPSQLSRYTLLTAEEFCLEGLNAGGFQALTIQDRGQPVSR